MDIYLGLGANMGQRRTQLGSALAALERRGVEVLRVSPIVESPAMLPDAAPPAWNLPFLNLVAQCRCPDGGRRLLDDIHAIERELGRGAQHEHWAPRPIDIDILLCGDERISAPDLTVPHPGLAERNFVLSPLAALAPGLELPGLGGKTVLAACRELPHHIPLWMGIVNVTPDSFSDGGTAYDPADHPTRAIDHARQLLDEGADLLDIGGESTRPGAEPVDADEELARILPVVEALAGDTVVSVDTSKAVVARAAVEAGALLVNDVSAGRLDRDLLPTVAELDVGYVLMHMRGTPRTMQQDTSYHDVVAEVYEFLARGLDQLADAGVAADHVLVDPGIGFGKTIEQNHALLGAVRQLAGLGAPVLIGTSRKSFLAADADLPAPADRVAGSVATATMAALAGAAMVRVHDVAQTRQAVDVARRMAAAGHRG